MSDETHVDQARDAAVVATLLLTGAFCVRCIMMKTDLHEARVRLLVEGVESYVQVTTRTSRCDGCGRVKVTHKFR